MRNLLSIVFLLFLSVFPKINFAFPPNLGAAANFIFFTPAGAIGNTGTSTITGDIGNNLGAITGLGAPTVFNGTLHNADITSWKVMYDVSAALGQLLTQTPMLQLPSTVGNEQIITAGIYNTVGTLNVDGNLILDGGGDTNAVFIFQINGAFTAAAASFITLTNGASASNVFWATNGAASLGANTSVSGTIIAKGAIDFGAATNFLGRAFSITGAINTNTFTGRIPNGPSITTVQPNCSGGVGSIIINAPVGTGYTYSINGVTYQSSSTFSSLTPGTYPITVRNNVGAIISSGVSSVINSQYQAANPYPLGTAGSFVLFTSEGAVSNTSTSDVASGDMGTNAGAISGMGSPSMVNGATHNADGITLQAKADLNTAYNNLRNQTATDAFPAAPADGQIFMPGIYSIAGASAINGNIILDAGNNANALFVFQIGGAFTTGTGASILLKNGADPSRIFWVVDGAAAFATGTTMMGNVINNAAISFGDNSILVGRALSTVGAVSIYGTLVSAPFQCYTAPIILPVVFGQFSAVAKNCEVAINFQVLGQQNNRHFEVESSTTLNGNWKTLTVIAGDAQNTTAKTYQYIHTSPAYGNNYYRIKQIDVDSKTTYSAIINAVNNCANIGFSSYPNPLQNKLTVLLPTGVSNATIRISNSLGQIIYTQLSGANENSISTAGFTTGVYILQVVIDNKIVFKHTIVKN